MATLLLSAAGAAIGGGFGGAILGISGAAIGQTIGAMLGNAIDQRLFAPGVGGTVSQAGARLEQATVTTSTEGSPVTRLQGRSRLSGQMIWSTRFIEEAVTTTTTTLSGGKFNRSTATSSATVFSYYANFAIGLCEGPITCVGRVWADGKEIDQTAITMRVYTGTETQMPDALIEGKEGAGLAPAYRGLAYVVFEHFPMADFGNRIPQITVEVYRALGDLEPMVAGVTILPGATEFGYDPTEITALAVDGSTTSLNRATKVAQSDWTASMDQLQALAPNCTTVALTVAWFGDDLRCDSCAIRPGVDAAVKTTFRPGGAHGWAVASVIRSTATLISTTLTGQPAFGGTPSDASVIDAIVNLKARGFEVLLHPVLIMDVPVGNTLPNPYSNNAATVGQAAYPWRGRITCSPAIGFTGTADISATAVSQINTFFTRAEGYNAFVLHMAGLAVAAGGVDAFLLGSELVGLTRVRNATNTFPAVNNLKTLAASVRAVLGAGTKISYGADWTEYHSYRPADGSGDVYFNMDALWADANIDFVGIQMFAPIADWRDGTGHLDYDAGGAKTIYDPDYLTAGIEGGEYFDWVYASPADRETQTRTAITDPAYGDPVVFRQKDIRNWWNRVHKHRPAGVRNAGATAWTAEMKPIWFTALGCPAIDKGANQPSAAIDAKSSESAMPWFSNGARDDAIQRAVLEAQLTFWATDPMIERSLVWGWDVRPGSIFGQDAKWTDTPNWQRGHWVSGRLGAAPAEETIRDIFQRTGFTDFEILPLGSVVDAVVTGNLASPRAMIETLAAVHHLQAVETGSAVRIDALSGQPVRATLGLGDLVRQAGQSDNLTRKRLQETDLPRELSLSWSEPTLDDQTASYKAIHPHTTSKRTQAQSLPIVMSDDKARAVAETMLREAWTGREALSAVLPPSQLALEPGDLMMIEGDTAAFRIEDIGDGQDRPMSGRRADPAASTLLAIPQDGSFRTRASGGGLKAGRAAIVFIDGPLLDDADRPVAATIGAAAQPWGNGVAVYRSPSTSGFTLETNLLLPAGIGSLVTALPVGPLWCWDRGSEAIIYMPGRVLGTLDDLAVLGGANMLAVQQASGEWEFLQFAEAELIAANTYRLTRLLRGQRGTEFAMGPADAPIGSTVVLIDAALHRTVTGTELKDLALNWRFGPAHLDVASSAFQQQTVTLKGNGLRPFAPVQLKGKRDVVSGDWTISWVRRTRFGGDSWALTEVPLNEETESYVLEILNALGSSVKRTVTQPGTAFVWTAAMQVADFGALRTSVKARIYQVSATFGRGVFTYEQMS